MMTRFFSRLLSLFLISYLCGFFVVAPVHAQVATMNSDPTVLDPSVIGAQTLGSQQSQTDLQSMKAMQGMTGQGGMSGAGFGMGFDSINVHVLGDVKFPGVYGAAVSERAVEVMKKAYPKRETLRVIQVRNSGKKTRYYDLYRYYYFGDLNQNPFLKPNDVVFVPPS